MKCLEAHVQHHEGIAVRVTTDVTILDGAAIVHMLPPGPVKTFREYVSAVFLPYIENLLERNQRVDLVWDQYFSHGLKTGARHKRGQWCKT